MKRNSNIPDYESDFRKNYLDAFVQDSVALPGPLQTELAKIVSQAYAVGQRGTNVDIGSMPFSDPGQLFKNRDLIPSTIGDAERLLARSYYEPILAAADKRSAGQLGVDPFELITGSVEKVMNAARTFVYDPEKKNSFDSYAGPQIFSSATGDARAETKPEQSNGTDDYWYNQLQRSLGENTVQTQFHTPLGARLVNADGTLNAQAAIRPPDALLPDNYLPAYVDRADVARYATAKEEGLIDGNPTNRLIESGLRKLNGNLAGGRGDAGDTAFMGPNAQEADASRLTGGEAENADIAAEMSNNMEDAVFHRESSPGLDATAQAGLLSEQNTYDRLNAGAYGMSRPKQEMSTPDGQLRSNNELFGSGSMAQQVELKERQRDISVARGQLREQGAGVPQTTYQLGEMQERLTFGAKLRPNYVARFKENNPGLVDLNRKQFGKSMARVRAYEQRKPEDHVTQGETYHDETVTGFSANPEGTPISSVGDYRGAPRHSYPPVSDVGNTPTPPASGGGNGAAVPP